MLCQHNPGRSDARLITIFSLYMKFSCISANYVNRSCNDRLKQCVERFQDANLTQFAGANCSATDLEDVIITMMNIATLGESFGSPSPLTNFQWVKALIINLPVVLLFENW